MGPRTAAPGGDSGHLAPVELFLRTVDAEAIPLWERVLEQLPIGAAWCFGGLVVGLNDEASRVLGVSRRRVPLAEWGREFELADGSGHRLSREELPMWRALHGERVARTRLQVIRGDGQEVDVSVQAYPLDGAAAPSAIVLAEDLTFSLEQERRFEEWLAALGHELAGTLHTSMMAARIALKNLDHPDPNVARGHLELSLKTAELLGRLVGDFVDAARLGAGTLDWSAVRISLAPFLDQVVAGARLTDRGHDIELSCDDEVATFADPHRLQQILTNLFSNARKYSSPGRLRLEVRAREGLVVVALSDDGPGISAVELPKLFQRYHRLPSREQGSGIGLWLCRELALRMGGDLSVQSRAGESTTFQLILPRAAA